MQPAAFLAAQRGADDEVGDLHQIAQLDQIRRDAEVAVIILHLLLQQINAVLRTFKPFGRPHNADEIPHELPDLAPALLDHDFFIAVGHAA